MAKNKMILMCVCVFASWYFHCLEAVRITSLDVPSHAWDSVKLNCRYDLEGQTLYGVKWYKDNVEFLRCWANGTIQEFSQNEFKTYHTGRSQTGSCYFELTALTSRSGGEYMCEVSLDWPTFQTVTESARLKIVQPSRSVQYSATIESDLLDGIESSNGSVPSSAINFHIFVTTLPILVFICNINFYQ